MTIRNHWFLAAITATVTCFQSPHAQPGNFPPGGEGMPEMIRPQMMKALNLTSEQRNKIRNFRMAREKKAIQLHSEKAMAEVDLMKIMQTYPVHTTELVKQGEKISTLEKQMHQMRLESLGFLLELLTPDQHQKFMEMHDDMRDHRRARFNTMRKGTAWGRSKKNGDSLEDRQAPHQQRESNPDE